MVRKCRRRIMRLYQGVTGTMHCYDVFATPAERDETTCGLLMPARRYQHMGDVSLITCVDCQLAAIMRRAYWAQRFFERFGELPAEYGARQMAEMPERNLRLFYGRRRVR